MSAMQEEVSLVQHHDTITGTSFAKVIKSETLEIE